MGKPGGLSGNAMVKFMESCSQFLGSCTSYYDSVCWLPFFVTTLQADKRVLSVAQVDFPAKVLRLKLQLKYTHSTDRTRLPACSHTLEGTVSPTPFLAGIIRTDVTGLFYYGYKKVREHSRYTVL